MNWPREIFKDLLAQIELKVNRENKLDVPFKKLTEAEQSLQHNATEKEIYGIFDKEMRRAVNIKYL